jgi:hypothetical protein
MDWGRSRWGLRRNKVKTSREYDTVAAFVTGIGVLFLVYIYLPIVNPGTYQVSFHHERLPSIAHYVIGTPIALLILAAGWHCNKQSEKLKKNGK